MTLPVNFRAEARFIPGIYPGINAGDKLLDLSPRIYPGDKSGDNSKEDDLGRGDTCAGTARVRRGG
jgi:hypothetical protein